LTGSSGKSSSSSSTHDLSSLLCPGQYVLTFDPSTLNSNLRIEEGKKSEASTMADSTAGRELIESGPSRQLSLPERVVALATAISADFGELLLV
jgi:hypothetical protein